MSFVHVKELNAIALGSQCPNTQYLRPWPYGSIHASIELALNITIFSTQYEISYFFKPG